jgi:hypothetical protein
LHVTKGGLCSNCAKRPTACDVESLQIEVLPLYLPCMQFLAGCDRRVASPLHGVSRLLKPATGNIKYERTNQTCINDHDNSCRSGVWVPVPRQRVRAKAAPSGASTGSGPGEGFEAATSKALSNSSGERLASWCHGEEPGASSRCHRQGSALHERDPFQCKHCTFSLVPAPVPRWWIWVEDFNLLMTSSM